MIRFLLISVLLASAAGCGLSAYEGKMAAAQRHAEAFEKKENQLGNMMAAPEGFPVPISMRLPRGVADKCDPVKLFGIFNRYPKSSGGSSTGIVELYLAGTADGNVVSFKQQLQRNFPQATALPAKVLEVRGKAPLIFDYWTDSDLTAKSYIFLHQSGNHILVLVFRAEAKASAETERAIDESLKTLTVGGA